MVEKFLMDSNSFITPYRLYYAPDLTPNFWKKLSSCTKSGRLVLLDMVKDEVSKGQDDLANWLKEQSGFVFCNHKSEEIVNKYQQILQYIQTCGLYKEQALHAWAQGDVADPWLIAAASVNNYTIITLEVSSGNLIKNTPNKNAKIPDVARNFGVKTNNLYYMMRQLKISI